MTARHPRSSEASPARRPARRPPARTVHVVVAEGEYAGWEATAKADFPAGVLAELQSDRMDVIAAALDRIVLDHNLPNEGDELAGSMAEVDPYDGMATIAGLIFDAIAKLPNR